MICLALLFVTSLTGIVTGDNTILTKNGYIRGKAVGSRGVVAFLGVPYAEPPVGSSRFEKPVAKTAWRGVHDATRLPPPCIQVRSSFPNITEMTEDCLFLNLWVPRIRKSCGLKPIVIFIHGGSFMFGASNWELYDGTRLVEYGDIIVASLNYRLGGLGFLYGSIDEAAGNMGMYDQVAALRWIKENAQVFGGDPNNIVLMGQSSGSYSVSAHLISPLSKNLFRRAILLSGSAIIYNEDIRNIELLQLSQRYANLSGCATDDLTLENNPKAIIDCMKRLPAETFSELDRKVFVEESTPFYPRIGDNFLPESPVDSYRKGYSTGKEILLGITRNEGSSLVVDSRPDLFGNFGELVTNVSFNATSTKQILDIFIKTGSDVTDEKIMQAYIKRVNSDEGYTYLRAMTDAVGDIIINCGVIFQADFHSVRNDPVYFYVFDYRSPSNPQAEWMGVSHFQDMPYYFGNPMYGNFTKEEKRITRNVMDMWVRFIKTGNPNIPRGRGGVRWPHFLYKDPKYMSIGQHKRVEWSPEFNRCEQWRNLYGSTIDDDISYKFEEF